MTDAIPGTDDAARLGDAAELLLDKFGSHVEMPYLPGKTAFRDELYARFQVSLLEAEELCDSLEGAGLIAYHEGRTEDEESAGWNITTGTTHETAM